MAIEPSVQELALQWTVRTGDPEFADWDAFTLWLEADPAHAATYDLIIASVDDALEAGLPAAPAGPVTDAGADNVIPLRRTFAARPGWIGGALAASLGLAVAIGVLFTSGTGKLYETAPGQVLQIALSDGGSIVLGGATRLRMTGPDAREATLEQGQALFTLTHDKDKPFEVNVGDDELIDIGTVFDVRRSGGSTTVSVAEGAVLFNPGQQRVRVNPGRQLVRQDGSPEIKLVDLPTALVGEWREGRLTFRDAALADIADDLTRASGIRFTTSPSAAQRRISGSVLVEPIRKNPASLGSLLGVNLRKQASGWTIEP